MHLKQIYLILEAFSHLGFYFAKTFVYATAPMEMWWMHMEICILLLWLKNLER